jgi:NADH:ubiquinone oxidoreductase subunit 6 (subunit J)
MELVELVYMAAVILFATFVATFIRVKDEPTTTDPKQILAIFVEILIAAVIIAWMLMEVDGLDIISFTGFVAIAGGSIGGVAGIKWIFDKFRTPSSSPGPPMG